MKILKTFAAGMLFAACGTFTGTAASYMFDNPDNKTYFGVRASLDVSSAANGGGWYSNKSGFSLGAVYNIPLYMNLYFEPGLSLFYNTFGTVAWDSFTVERPLENPEVGGPTTEEVAIPFQRDGSIRNLGFRIPLQFGYHFDVTDDIKVHLFTGPQFNLSLLSRYHQNAVLIPEVASEAESCSLFGTHGFKHFDVQWNFGVGVDYQNYYLALSGSWGMTRMKDNTIELPHNLRRNIFAITLGYNF